MDDGVSNRMHVFEELENLRSGDALLQFLSMLKTEKVVGVFYFSSAIQWMRCFLDLVKRNNSAPKVRRSNGHIACDLPPFSVPIIMRVPG